MTKSRFDFNVIHKRPEPARPKRALKRVVRSSDIINSSNRSVTKKSGTPKHIVQSQKNQAGFHNKNSTLNTNTRQTKLLPVIATLCLIALLVQFAGYLMNAKDSTGVVLGSATTAYDSLDQATKSLNEMDFSSAKNNFTSAQDSLFQAQTELNKFWPLTTTVPQAKGADNVLRGASFLAEAGKNLTRALQLFDEIEVGSGGISTENFTSKLQDNHNLLKNSRLMLTYAQENFEQASGLPSEYSETLEHAKNQIHSLTLILDNIIQLEDLFLSFFGTQPKTYLLTFQNYDEMRATGGFIGTYGILKYQNGIINQLKIESIYNIDGSLTKQIAAPGPFQPDIQKWALRDANWFVDFPTSAKKMLEFFEMESQTADGVIAMTPKIFEDILKLVGNIRMDQYDVVLTPDNFQEVVQNQTSHEYDRELNQPKKFLDDFAPVLLNRMSSLGQEEWFTLFQILRDNFLQKHVMMYSVDETVQEKISQLGFDAKIHDAPHDYLAIFNSNHGGTKTDLEIDQKIDFNSHFESKGQIVNTVRISRTNSSDQLTNTSFMRILVPLGSQLIEVDGFLDKPQHKSEAEGFTTDPDLAEWDKGEKFGNSYIRSEAGKTSFTGWVETAPQSTSVITVKYVLPIQIQTNWLRPRQAHSLLFQKQPGAKTSTLTGTWSSDSKDLSSNLSTTFSASGRTDMLWPVVIGR